LCSSFAAQVDLVARFRWQIGVNFRRDFRLLYKKTGLGWFWAFALPVVPITIYVLLAKLRFFPQADGMDPAVYITTGVTLWFLFSGAVLLPLQSVESQGGIAVRTEYPLIGVVMASFAQLVFDTLVRIAAVAVVFAYTQTVPPWHVLAAPFLVTVLLPLFFGLGLIFSIANVAFSDVGKVATIALQYGIFLSAVIFPLPERFIIWNPFALALDSVRDLLVTGDINHPVPLLILVGVGLLVLLIGVRLFHRMEYRVKGLL
jgi:lipopolysaccharide transport system permease protein